MARITLGTVSLTFALDSRDDRLLAAVLLDTVGRTEEARLLRDGIADRQMGQVTHILRDGWRVRVNVSTSTSGVRRGIVDVTMPPNGVVEYEMTSSEASGDGSDAACLWLCLCAISSPEVRMDVATFLRWLVTIRLRPRTSRGAPDHRDQKRESNRRLVLELAARESEMR